ncbi:hypothetical protein SAY87_007116 [Trapa incisa]|uniref:WAT1-related protein n=1 Tax=Trapa incisa TaxID=236973 RepID=A0AAN7K2G2_9MYRT|nr:hypothetical protein SAY87_007116 [Trapa incisa]
MLSIRNEFKILNEDHHLLPLFCNYYYYYSKLTVLFHFPPTCSMAGAVGVVAGLYIVLWGKAEDIRPVSGEVKLPNAVKTAVYQNDLEKLACKIDLEEPLLSSNPSSDVKEESCGDKV